MKKLEEGTSRGSVSSKKKRKEKKKAKRKKETVKKKEILDCLQVCEVKISSPPREEIFINYIANWRVDRGRAKDGRTKLERETANFVKGSHVRSRSGRNKKEKESRLFTVYRCRLRVTAKNSALGKAVKANPGLTTSNASVAQSRTLSFSLLALEVVCRFRLPGN